MSSLMLSKLYPANHKTVFVLDHSAYFAQSSHFPIELDPPDKPRGIGFIPIAPIFKSLWTCTLEAVLEYCRIVWDLFPERKFVRIIVSDTRAQHLNSWNQEEQNLLTISNALHNLEPISTSTEASVLKGLKSSISALCDSTCLQAEKIKLEKESSSANQSKILNRCRVICVTSCADSSRIEKLKELVKDEILHQNNKLLNKEKSAEKLKLCIDSCHLIIINVYPNNISNIETMYKLENPNATQHSLHLSTEVHSVKAGWQLANKLSHLIQDHYDLSSTTVTGIPMKEETNANSSANYDVEIFHPSEVHAALLKGNLADVSQVRTLKEGSTYETITLRWSTPRNTVTELHNCTCAHRITPVDVNSRPSSCLINFLLNGRSVNLEIIRRTGGKVISHMLTSHGGDIFMHTLATGRSILEDPPSISEGCGGRVTDYRITDFGIFMRANKLLPAKNVSQKDKYNEKMKKKLERQTLYWPLTLSTTFIFNNKQIFEPLVSLMQREEITDNCVTQCNQCIYNLVALEAKHETLLPNNPSGTRGKGIKRDEQYKQIWTELEHFIKIHNRSDNHAKVLQTLLDFRNKSSSSHQADDNKLIKVDLNQALRELDLIKDMNASGNSSGMFERASVIRTTDSPKSPPPLLFSKLKYSSHKPRSLLDICVARNKQIMNKSKRADFHGRLNAELGPNGVLKSQLYPDLQIKEDSKATASAMVVD